MVGTGELKPCPFCGGEASKRLFYRGKYRVHCNVCDAHSGDVCETEAEAIAAWNTRAERTCHDYNASAREHGAYLFMWRCSNCGESYDTEMDKPNYCPNCGAKVVS